MSQHVDREAERQIEDRMRSARMSLMLWGLIAGIWTFLAIIEGGRFLTVLVAVISSLNVLLYYRGYRENRRVLRRLHQPHPTYIPASPAPTSSSSSPTNP